METDIKQLARTFRFERWENLPSEVVSKLRENVRAVADSLPRLDGETLFELLELPLPENYVGQPESSGTDTLAERLEYKVSKES